MSGPGSGGGRRHGRPLPRETDEAGFNVADLAFLYHCRGDYSRTEQYSREAISIFSGRLGVDPAHEGRALAGLANLDGTGIGADERMQMFEEGLAIFRGT